MLLLIAVDAVTINSSLIADDVASTDLVKVDVICL